MPAEFGPVNYEAVLLDLDDTCYPYPACNEAGKRAAWRRARDLGYEWDRDEFDERYAAARRAVKREIAETAAEHERYLYVKRLLREATGTHRARDAVALGDAFWEAYLEEMTLFPGVEETLAELDDLDVDLAIVSNLTTRIQLEKIDRLGIERYLDLVVTSEETGREKPAGVMFTTALSELERTPSETALVGDSVPADVEGANAVGITTILFNEDATDLSGLRRPDHRIDDFRAVTEVVR